ncbi:hypothetical protein DE146DRAFT_651011 [Phaeosphaeria sp. MPI-PUGE-AT-0046c]|nr:hypothetical protein DE146DRAFT_651011 [Phaeosphaeria sp. MPI-PUGE-AT-0046c]
MYISRIDVFNMSRLISIPFHHSSQHPFLFSCTASSPFSNSTIMSFPIPKGVSTYHTSPYPSIDVARPELSTAGKVILITGGGTGIGLATAQHFAKAGCTTIAITGRRSKVLAKAQKLIQDEYPATKVLTLASDVMDREGMVEAFKRTSETFASKVDVLINNAGYLPSYKSQGSAEKDSDEWWKAFTTNVRGAHNVLNAFLPVAAQDATVINVSSGAMNATLAGQSAYIASKTAAARVFECFQAENPGFRVVNLAPGIVLTDMHQKSVDHFDEIGAEQAPLDDVELPASYMVWACSPEAVFIKGKFVWVHWDVNELKRVLETTEDKQLLTLSINGMANWGLL